MRKASLLILFITLSLCACYHAPIKMDFVTAKQLNRNELGQSLAVQLRVYQLTDKSAFMTASFTQLWKDDRNVLGKQLLYCDEVTVTPNRVKPLTITRAKGTRYIGVFAIFRDPSEGQWRDVTDVPSSLYSWWIPLNVKLHDAQIKFAE